MAKVEHLRREPPQEAAEPARDRGALEGQGLTKRYAGRAVVDNVAVHVRNGEIVGLLGPNGAGKTTTFYMLVGLLRPDAGNVLLGGENIETLPLNEEERQARLQSLLDELDIARLAKSRAGVLSGGERRKVEITRALVL